MQEKLWWFDAGRWWLGEHVWYGDGKWTTSYDHCYKPTSINL